MISVSTIKRVKQEYTEEVNFAHQQSCTQESLLKKFMKIYILREMKGK